MTCQHINVLTSANVACILKGKWRMRRVRNRLNELMKERDLTQAELAEKMGVSPGTISRWTRNQIDLYDKTLLEKFMDFFDCDITDILVTTQDEK